MKKYLPIIGLLLLVVYIGCGGNTAPVINDITFNPTAPYPGDTVACTADATDEELAEAILVAASLRAGGALVHSCVAIEAMEEK